VRVYFFLKPHSASSSSSIGFVKKKVNNRMGSTAAAAEKSEEELRREIDELLRQQRQVPFYSLSLSLSLSLSKLYAFLLFCVLTKKKKKTDNGASSRSSGTPQGRLFRCRPSQPGRQRTSSARFPSTRMYPLPSILYLFPHKNETTFDFIFGFEWFQADRTDAEDQHPAKRRLSSAVVKVKNPLFG
jgi:hypothetical protein